MLKQIKISSGVNVYLNDIEYQFVTYLAKLSEVSIDILNSDQRYVIKKLLSKSVITRTKRGNYVYIRLRRGIKIPAD